MRCIAILAIGMGACAVVDDQGSADLLESGAAPQASEPALAAADTTSDIDPPLADADGDGYNDGEDCDDEDASIYPGATEDCSDGVDGDCDGLIDCEDSDCLADPACAEDCADEIDNDGDGLVDCDDDDCWSVPGCLEADVVAGTLTFSRNDAWWQGSCYGCTNGDQSSHRSDHVVARDVSGTLWVPLEGGSYQTCDWTVVEASWKWWHRFNGDSTWRSSSSSRTGFEIDSDCAVQSSGFLPALFPDSKKGKFRGRSFTPQSWYVGSLVDSDFLRKSGSVETYNADRGFEASYSHGWSDWRDTIWRGTVELEAGSGATADWQGM